MHGDVHDAGTLPGGPRRAAAPPTTWCTPWTPRTSSDSTPRRRVPSAGPPPRPGVQQIIYLGGLGSDVRPALRAPAQPPRGGGPAGSAGVPVTVLRAGIIVGQWRDLVGDDPPARRPPARHGHPAVGAHPDPADRVDDVVRYLVGVLGEPRALGRVFEIGGPEVLEYLTMMRRVARIKNRRLAIVPVPLLSPGLSSRWLALVTDVDTQTGRSLIDSMTQRGRGTRRQHPRRGPVRADGLRRVGPRRAWPSTPRQQDAR